MATNNFHAGTLALLLAVATMTFSQVCTCVRSVRRRLIRTPIPISTPRPTNQRTTQLAYNYGSFICAGLFAGICFLAASVALYFHVQVYILMCTYTHAFIYTHAPPTSPSNKPIQTPTHPNTHSTPTPGTSQCRASSPSSASSPGSSPPRTPATPAATAAVRIVPCLSCLMRAIYPYMTPVDPPHACDLSIHIYTIQRRGRLPLSSIRPQPFHHDYPPHAAYLSSTPHRLTTNKPTTPTHPAPQATPSAAASPSPRASVGPPPSHSPLHPSTAVVAAWGQRSPNSDEEEEGWGCGGGRLDRRRWGPEGGGDGWRAGGGRGWGSGRRWGLRRWRGSGSGGMCVFGF